MKKVEKLDLHSTDVGLLITGCIAPEEVFYRALDRQAYRPLRSYPAFVGISGGNGRDYSKISKPIFWIYDRLCRLGLFNRCYWVVRAIKRSRKLLKRS